MKLIIICKFFVAETILFNFTFIQCKVSKDVLELPMTDHFITVNLRESPQNIEDIFEALEHYRSVLYKVNRIVLHHDRFQMEDATYVYNMGRPNFLNVPVDKETLKKKFEWYPGQIGGLVLLKSEIEEFWDQFTQRYKIVKTSYNL